MEVRNNRLSSRPLSSHLSIAVPFALLALIWFAGYAYAASPVQLPDTSDEEMSHAGRSYRIFTATVGEVPEGGYPVIYVLDANGVFGSVRDELRRQHDAAFRSPALLVGIGYPGEAPWADTLRSFDLTPKVPDDQVPRGPGGRVLPETGGAAIFRAFLLDELRPAIEARFAVNKKRQTLMGHSYGGLFTLDTLLTQPEAFQNFVAMSPSIWFAEIYLHNGIRNLPSKLDESGAHPRLLLTAGSCEQTDGECDPQIPRSDIRRQWLEEQTRMVDRAESFLALLDTTAGNNMDIRKRYFADEHHISVIGASLSRAVRFALTD